MLNLNTCDLNDVARFGLSLLTTYRSKFHSFEEAATLCVQSIYNEFRQPDNQPTFALVRIYRLCRYDELLPELKTIATPEVTQWMALMGTIGTDPAWCDRHTSQGHKVIRAVGDRSPMLSAAFEQIGLERLKAKDRVQPDALPMREASLLTKYFHVPRALGSAFVPAQQDFVVPYGIESVVGIGSGFVSMASYLALCFSTHFISEEAAVKFAELSSFVSTLLAIYDGAGVIWDPEKSQA